jgi:hypothetical protein
MAIDFAKKLSVLSMTGRARDPSERRNPFDYSGWQKG